MNAVKLYAPAEAAQTPTDWLIFSAVRCLTGVVGRIPRAAAYWLSEILALVVYVLDPKHRRIALTNLEIAFPEKDVSWRKKVLRDSYRQLGNHFVEICSLPRITAQEIRQKVHYDSGFGLEQYINAKTRGKGVLFLTAHVSAWELLPIAHAVLGHPLSFVVRPLDNIWLDRWATKIRSRFGNHVIRKQSSLRRILKLLKENRDVGLLIDQNVQEKDGVFVPFFGTLACTAASPAALALRTGSPIVLGFMIPGERRGHYRIRFYPPIEVCPSQDRGADLYRYTSEFNQILEAVIREFPHCWLWGHRRFRTRKDHHDPYA